MLEETETTKLGRNFYTRVPWSERPSLSANSSQYAGAYFCSVLKNRTAK